MLKRFKNLLFFFKDPDKKPTRTILKELVIFSYAKKSIPTDYFRKFLYRQGVKDYKAYLSLKEYYTIIESPKLVYPEISALLENKLSFNLICSFQGLPVSNLISYNLKNWFLYDKKSYQIINNKELILFFKRVLKTKAKTKMFLKPMKGIGGAGCILLTSRNIKKQMDQYGASILKESYIHEDYIEQHPDINKIHPHAINTLRIIHYIDKNNIIHILSALMRFGVGESITDNVSTGGFSIAINSNTGALESFGRQKLTNGAAVYTSHPETNIPLDGVVIPYFYEACNLVKLAAVFFPNRIVGWDIAITVSGPVIIEGNHNPSLHMSDVAFGGYKKHPFIQEILNEIKT